MIQIIAHRGYWLEPTEKNTLQAFSRALKHGFGIETDFRDLNGKLVVSHDTPIEGTMMVNEFVEIYKQLPVSAPMALNIKSDGLHHLIKDLITQSNMKNYFVFDMSVPDTIGYINSDISVFTRLSEYETTPAFFEKSFGVWLDAFESEWYDKKTIQALLDDNKNVAIVSSELHRRPYLELWKFLKEAKFHLSDKVYLCTDFPLEAREYFNG